MKLFLDFFPTNFHKFENESFPLDDFSAPLSEIAASSFFAFVEGVWFVSSSTEKNDSDLKNEHKMATAIISAGAP